MTVLQIVIVSIVGGLLVLSIALLPVWIFLYKRHRGRKAIEEVARHFHGHTYGDTCCAIPQLVIQLDGHRFHILIRKVKNEFRFIIYLTGSWPNLQTRLSLYPETFWSRAKKFIGINDMQVGNLAFDDTFVIHADSNQTLNDHLQLEIQRDLLALRQGSDLNLNIYGGAIKLSLELKRMNAAQIIETINRFAELRKSMLYGAVYDAIVVQPGGVVVGSIKETLAKCMVCGTGVTNQRVNCKRCHTPHHEDCWVYFGSCSRYGCGESEFVKKK